MALKNNGRLSRREMLKALSLLSAGGMGSVSTLLSGCRSSLLTDEDKERLGHRRDRLGKPPRFLIVLAATGGASIIDSFMAVRAGESANALTLNTFPDAQVTNVPGTPFRAVSYSAGALGSLPVPVNTNQTPFVLKHRQDMLVAANIGTSVNHTIAQKRSITGNGAWQGRTLQECMALEYGDQFPLPNVNMGLGGFLERGADDSLPAYCYAEPVSDTTLFPLGLDGTRGILGAPDKELVQLARALRNDRLDPQSIFGQTFEKSARLKRWIEQRGSSQQAIEAADLITRLNVLPDQPPSIPLTQYGLSSSPDAAALRGVFPNYFTDPVEGQAAMAFLLLKYRVSCAVTIAPSFNLVVAGSTLGNPPLAFDFSHQDHRGGQAFMWTKMLSIADRLIDLLKAEPYDATSGESLWDNSLIFVATDFGRTRTRPSGQTTFSTGHDMNNGFLMLSPKLKGNTVLGGVDPNTTQLFGFDPESGTPQPTKTLSNERDIFSGVLHTLGVDTSGSGLPDAKAFRKA